MQKKTELAYTFLKSQYRKWDWVLLLIAASSLIQAVVNISLHPDHFQNDIHTYYYSPLGWLNGQNPYRELFFVYPPMILKTFSLFSQIMSYPNFYQFFLFCHAIVIILWVLLSWKVFLPKFPLGFYALFAWLIGDGSLYRDLHAGNITAYESLILLGAFHLLLQEKLYAFVFMVILAASFKLTPLLFLLLLFLSPSSKKFKALGLATLAIIALAGLNLFISPELSKDFLYQASYRVEELHGFTEHGFFAPSILAFLRQYTSVLSPIFPWIGYLIFSLMIAVISGIKLSKISPSIQKKSILYFIMAYLLFLPRLKNYSSVLAVPSIIYFLSLTWKEKHPSRWVIGIVAVLVTMIPGFEWMGGSLQNIAEYHVLFGLIGVWWIATGNLQLSKE